MKTKEKILKALKDFGRLPTSRIAGIVGSNHKQILIHMEVLIKEEKVIKHEETNAIYWELRK